MEDFMEQPKLHLPSIKAPKRQKKIRDPYDGLRPWSAITHGAGAVAGLVAGCLLLLRVAETGPLWRLIPFAVYVLSMVGLYTASTLYHCLNTPVSGRLALRKYDHISIYYLIAGSYTPICIVALPIPFGWIMTGIIWVLALGGTVLTLVWLSAPRWLTSSIYIGLGWLAVFMIPALMEFLPAMGFFWLLLGGVLYTVGGLLYALKWPGRDNPRFGCHEIFHVFILLGSICHFLLMYQVIAML